MSQRHRNSSSRRSGAIPRSSNSFLEMIGEPTEGVNVRHGIPAALPVDPTVQDVARSAVIADFSQAIGRVVPIMGNGSGVPGRPVPVRRIAVRYAGPSTFPAAVALPRGARIALGKGKE